MPFLSKYSLPTNDRATEEHAAQGESLVDKINRENKEQAMLIMAAKTPSPMMARAIAKELVETEMRDEDEAQTSGWTTKVSKVNKWETIRNLNGELTSADGVTGGIELPSEGLLSETPVVGVVNAVVAKEANSQT